MLQNRRFERVPLSSPVHATAGITPVLLVDVSRTGFKVHHHEQLPPKGTSFTLRFRWNGSPAGVECVTIWTTIHAFASSASDRPTFSSGLLVKNADASSAELLEAMIVSLSGSSANEAAVADGGQVNAPYLFCELTNSSWKQRRTSTREQPGEGFTLSASEDATQIERLCAAYAGGDGETRKLIRTLAALSIKSQGESTSSP